ncbi:MAG: hypothetical protein JXB48_18000 [Candidatus Latescibacteria bacterium]|nr:hypothetical protein [Candidatus Latescibacterota bacterium]
MSRGIGIRYNKHGVRLLSLDRSEKKLKITGIAAGPPEETLNTFLKSKVTSDEDTAITIGLGPGDFLSSTIIREGDMTGTNMKEHLHWEIERKMISSPSEFICDYFITDTVGCVFAGNRSLIGKRKEALSEFVTPEFKIFTDVEPVALYNGSEGAGEIENNTIMFISIEAEGISSLLINNGSLNDLESVPFQEDELIKIIPGLDSEGMNNIDDATVGRISGYIIDSLKRLTSFGEYKDKLTPKKLILSGGGVYIGDLTEVVGKSAGIPAVISNPLKLLAPENREDRPELADMGAAFTTCFGLALRALED